jgi:beta-mannosidase
MGPDRPITLHLYTTRLSEVWTKAEVSEKLDPSLEVDVTVEGGHGEVLCRLKREDGKVIKEEKTQAGKGCIKWDLKGLVDLWWPNGHGPAIRYTFSVDLLSPVRHPLSSIFTLS